MLPIAPEEAEIQLFCNIQLKLKRRIIALNDNIKHSYHLCKQLFIQESLSFVQG